MSDSKITVFDEEYHWLSNFYLVRVQMQGQHYPSVENAYQAAKQPEDRRESFKLISPGMAKRLGMGKCPTNWDAVKLPLMEDLLHQKFAKRSRSLRAKLLRTADRELIKGNNWHDNFWGYCVCGRATCSGGLNNLGKLLESVRTNVRSFTPYLIRYVGCVAQCHVVTVMTASGPRAFYKRTGMGGTNKEGANQGDWAPFDGWRKDGYFIKEQYWLKIGDLHRFGTPDLKDVGLWLNANDPVKLPVTNISHRDTDALLSVQRMLVKDHVETALGDWGL